ncbi:FAD-dependent oxidoreductase [Tabrizicola piscis]|uniref:FAD-dependent oxidoreductase n=1 Tax=Tabrizicola piscis TaxID=2494374 RepID=A0A3S8U2P7_9RHOB|nr:FAD-dependent oxidoreductase [Tabrizicola piscis]AZL57847.1 FAD-dependent oxidoreductase [Tabrizicola piscis]
MAQTDVIVIGAGPAGLSAATALARLGVAVTVLDREAVAGGIPRHCNHPPYGLREFRRLMRGPAYAQRLVAEAKAAGVTIRTQTTVTFLHPGGRIDVTSPEGVETLAARAVLLATGVRETSRAARLIGGEKPGGVMSTGALQGIVHLNGQRPFQRPVILGTELVAFSALLTCRHAGIKPVAMIEPARRITARSPAIWLARLMGVPVLLEATVDAIHGRTRVEGVQIDRRGTLQDMATDGVIVSGGFRPEATLLRLSHLEVDPGSGGPVIDLWGRLSDPAYFAAGNLLRGVETAGWCWAEGRRVARAIHAALLGQLPAPEVARLRLGSDAVRLALPQVLPIDRPKPSPADSGAADGLQLRLNRPAKGRLRLMQDGVCLMDRRIDSLPERRITLPLPALRSASDVTLTLEER